MNINAQKKRDYDGSQFQVASLSDIHAWRVKAADKEYFRGHVLMPVF